MTHDKPAPDSSQYAVPLTTVHHSELGDGGLGGTGGGVGGNGDATVAQIVKPFLITL